MISTVIYTLLALAVLVYVTVLVVSLITTNKKVSSINELKLVEVYDTIINDDTNNVKFGIIAYENNTYSGFEVVLIKNNKKYLPRNKCKYSNIEINTDFPELIPFVDDNNPDNDLYITINEYVFRKLCDKKYDICEKHITFHLLKMYNDVNNIDNYLRKEFCFN